MTRIATISYKDINFVWISNHYDIHINGLCKMGNSLFWFQTINPEEDELKCDIYMLSFWEEIKLRTRKFLFEQMVGYHWTYPHRKNSYFHYRKPEWLYKRLFKLYYKLKKL